MINIKAVIKVIIDPTSPKIYSSLKSNERIILCKICETPTKKKPAELLRPAFLYLLNAGLVLNRFAA